MSAVHTTHKTSFYRGDLDGLRGIAVLLVAVFHIWFGRVSGGVDVFLTLSGFFFGGKLLRILLRPDPNLSPRGPLTQLVRRLVPTLVVVLGGCGLLTIWIQPQTRWESFAHQCIASLGYYQNWYLARTVTDYLRAGQAVSPLQHIWSMSVQGQFYLCFLLIVYGFAFCTKRLLKTHLRTGFIVLLSMLTVGSFLYALMIHHTNQPWAYYDSAARAWELLLGALTGALIHRIHFPEWVRNSIAVISLILIFACGWIINGVQQFPGPWALLPVGATIGLILAGANRYTHPSHPTPLPPIERFLASRPLRQLGSISYPLYLWHWPLLIFWLAHTKHRHASFGEGLAILAVSLILAYLTHHTIEQPLRYPKTSYPTTTISLPRMGTIKVGLWQQRAYYGLASSIVVIIAGLIGLSLTWQRHLDTQQTHTQELVLLTPQDYPGAQALLKHLTHLPKVQMRPSILEAKRDLPASTRDGCISNFADSDLHKCLYGDTQATRTIALAGGSHAEHWLPALDILGHQHHFKVITYLKMGCPLSTEEIPLIIGSNAPYPGCHKWVAKAMDQIIYDHPDFVFTTSTRPWNIKPGDVMPATYIGVWKRLSDNHIPILAMRDTPWIVHDDNSPSEPADCLAAGGNAITCGMKRSAVLSPRNPTLDFVKQFPLLKPLDMSDAVCEAEICKAIEGNVLIYHDSHHLSATYARTMAPELGRQLALATGWWQP